MSGPRPTLDTVAAAAGVSRMTVSNTYNRPAQVSPATRERVLEAARRLGYAGPDPAAASLRLGRSRTVGVVLTERLPYAFADPGLITILHGIATELSGAGNALLLVPSFGADGESLLRHAIVDALILCSLDARDPAVAAALERNVPLVTVGNPRLPKVPHIGPDNRRAAAELAQYLFELGHRRFGLITTVSGQWRVSSQPIFHQRVAGFREALLAAGVEPSELTVAPAAENTRVAGREAAAELFGRARGQRPTAVFAVTDILGFGVMDAAEQAGLAVPGAVSVAGFDDIAAAEPAGLTTIAHDLFGQGRAAARLALRRVAGETPRPPRIEAPLVVRASTGRAPRR